MTNKITIAVMLGLAALILSSPQAQAATVDLGTLGGSDSYAGAVNANGQVVGRASLAGNTASHASLWSPGPTVVPVTIDISPGTARNLVVPWLRAPITVAIISDASFDAASVDPSSVRFGPLGAAPVHSTLRNVGGDRRKDLVLQFDLRATGIACGDTSASLIGSTVEGTAIESVDAIRTVLCLPPAPAPE